MAQEAPLFKPANWLETASDVKLANEYAWLGRQLDYPIAPLWPDKYALHLKQATAIYNEMQARKARRIGVAA